MFLENLEMFYRVWDLTSLQVDLELKIDPDVDVHCCNAKFKFPKMKT